MKYENLPIFRAALKLCVYIETIVKGFEKYHKYTIGVDLRTASKELLFLIHRANISTVQKRVEVLQTLRDGCENVKMLIILSKELKAFKSFNQFEHSTKLAIEVCKQSQAWLDSYNKTAGVSK